MWLTMRKEQTMRFVSMSFKYRNTLLLLAINSVVYDSVEYSPNYDGTINDLYIDERDLIELPPVN